MNSTILLAIFLALVVLAIIVATGVLAFSGAASASKRLRARLAQRLRGTLFFRMLKRRYRFFETYVLLTPLNELEETLHSCESCAHIAECEDTLSKPESQGTDYSFCPNDPKIRKLESVKKGTGRP